MTQPVIPIPEWQQPSPRPTALTVVAIIGIVYAVLGLLCLSWGIVNAAIVQGTSGATPMGFRQDPEILRFQAASGAVGIGLSLTLLIGSIGLLYLKSVARTLLLVFAPVDLLYLLARMLLTIIWVAPRVQASMAKAPAMPNVSPQMIHTITLISALLTWLFTCAMPIVLLVVLTRPRVRAAFEKTA